MSAERSVVKWPSLPMVARWSFSQRRRNKWWKSTGEKKRKRKREPKEVMMVTSQRLSWPLTPKRWELSGTSLPNFLSPFCVVFVLNLCISAFAPRSQEKIRRDYLFFMAQLQLYKNPTKKINGQKTTVQWLCSLSHVLSCGRVSWKFNFSGWQKGAVIFLLSLVKFNAMWRKISGEVSLRCLSHVSLY